MRQFNALLAMSMASRVLNKMAGWCRVWAVFRDGLGRYEGFEQTLDDIQDLDAIQLCYVLK